MTNLPEINPAQKILKSVIFCLLVSLPFFINLDSLPVRLWDESRLAVNTYEMYRNGKWMVTHYEGLPDLWNTKPPLLIWLQVLLFKLIGPGELALRLPSAIAGFLTCVVIALWVIHLTGSFITGLSASLVLATTNGFVDLHVTRTGDYDSLLVFFTTLYCFCFFQYLRHGHNRWIYAFFIALTLGVMTKGIQATLFLPALAIWLLIERKTSMLISNRAFFAGLSAFLLITAGFYLCREFISQGYLKAVWENEIGGRYVEDKDHHRHEFLYYFYQLKDYHYTHWIILLPCGMVAGLACFYLPVRKLTLFCLIAVLSYWMVISFSNTKLTWYAAPLYPFLAIMVAMLIYPIYSWAHASPSVARILNPNAVSWIILFLFVISPYRSMINKVYKPQEASEHHKVEYMLSRYLKDAVKGKHQVKDFSIVFDGYAAHLLYYVYRLQDAGQPVSIKPKENLKKGDRLVLFQQDAEHYIRQNYPAQLINSYKNLRFYQIGDTVVSSAEQP